MNRNRNAAAPPLPDPILVGDEEGLGGFTALPAGIYTLTLSDTPVNENATPHLFRASTGRDMLKVAYVVEDDEYQGRVIFNNYVVGAEGWALKRDMAAIMGVDRENVGNLTLGIIKSLMGSKALADVELRNGYNNIIKLLPLDDDDNTPF